MQNLPVCIIATGTMFVNLSVSKAYAFSALAWLRVIKGASSKASFILLPLSAASYA
jgi:hypothetical protein